MNEHKEMIMTGEYESTWRKTFSSVDFSTV